MYLRMAEPLDFGRPKFKCNLAAEALISCSLSTGFCFTQLFYAILLYNRVKLALVLDLDDEDVSEPSLIRYVLHAFLTNEINWRRDLQYCFVVGKVC